MYACLSLFLFYKLRFVYLSLYFLVVPIYLGMPTRRMPARSTQVVGQLLSRRYCKHSVGCSRARSVRRVLRAQKCLESEAN